MYFVSCVTYMLAWCYNAQVTITLSSRLPGQISDDCADHDEAADDADDDYDYDDDVSEFEDIPENAIEVVYDKVRIVQK